METKKMYEQPRTEEIKIAMNQIMCSSPGDVIQDSPRYVPEED